MAEGGTWRDPPVVKAIGRRRRRPQHKREVQEEVCVKAPPGSFAEVAAHPPKFVSPFAYDLDAPLQLAEGVEQALSRLVRMFGRAEDILDYLVAKHIRLRAGVVSVAEGFKGKIFWLFNDRFPDAVQEICREGYRLAKLRNDWFHSEKGLMKVDVEDIIQAQEDVRSLVAKIFVNVGLTEDQEASIITLLSVGIPYEEARRQINEGKIDFHRNRRTVKFYKQQPTVVVEDSVVGRVVIIRRLIIICNMLGLYYDIRIIKRILPRQVGHHCTHDVTQVGAAVLDTWGLEVPQAPPGYESRHSSGIAPCGWWCLGSPAASPLHPTRATALHRGA